MTLEVGLGVTEAGKMSLGKGSRGDVCSMFSTPLVAMTRVAVAYQMSDKHLIKLHE